uniref:ABC transmembrane type-1 domain-containing protein n=1 Tax=Populus alba TaxID=43335 RepID=A0A4U5NQT1_POPAL|nr:hypothetical protein D5086_0000249460 [Populus alba]
MGETLTERFREAFFEKILTFEIEWFDQENNSSGALCARLATDAVMMRTLVTDRLSLLTQAVSSATLAVVLAFMLSWRLALVAIALEPGVIAAIYLREMSMRIMSKKTLKAQSASSALASEAVGNHKIITAFGSQEKVVKLYDRSQVSSGKESNSQSWYAGTINGGIEFKQVYFIYPARPKQIILRGVDLKIEASKIVALVGRSGSGKATTIRLIERFYDTLSGSIEVDGINIMCSNLRASRSHIALDFKNGITEIQTLRSNLNAEIKKTEALEFTCKSINQENERLRKLYTGSLNNLAEELERRTKCVSLNEELKRLRDELINKEDEHKTAVELLKKDYTTKVGDLEDQIRGFLLGKETNEATVTHLRQDLAAHKAHMQTLANRLDRVAFEVESKYHLELQDLKDCLMVEQEEKNELNKKLQGLEKELLISKTKRVEQQQDLASSRLVETLKQKIMKLRKENEILKRKLSHSEEG